MEETVVKCMHVAAGTERDRQIHTETGRGSREGGRERKRGVQ